MKVTLRNLVGSKEPLASELKLKGSNDEARVEAMVSYPILMNRPIAVSTKGRANASPAKRWWTCFKDKYVPWAGLGFSARDCRMS